MTLAFETGISEPKMHALLRLAGFQISRGQIAAIFQKMTERLPPQAVLLAAMNTATF